MADPDPVVDAAKHIGAGGGIGALAAAVMHWWRGKKAEEQAAELVKLRAEVNDLVEEVKLLRRRSHAHGNHITALQVHTDFHSSGPHEVDNES